MDAKMSSHAQHVIQQFAKNVTHGIYNVKIVRKKMELALLQQVKNVDVCHMTLDVKLDAGGRKIKIMFILSEDSLDSEFYFGY